MAQHTNWHNRTPTYFISLFDDWHGAVGEAQRRKQQTRVRDRNTGLMLERDFSSVKIAEISALKLDRFNVFYFSTSELISMLQLPLDTFFSRIFR
jgi:hypothetical protein